MLMLVRWLARSIGRMTDSIDAERARLTEIIHEAGGQIRKSHFLKDKDRAEIEYRSDGRHFFRVTIEELAVAGVPVRP
jgi:hypothetical protein